MEHRMRRFRQLLDEDAVRKLLAGQTNGVLSLKDVDGEPYGVPLSFAYDGDRAIYFHSAVQGHKIDCISAGSACSFCVVGQDLIVPEKFTTYFRSVIVSGNIAVIEDKNEILKGLRLLCEKYSPGIESEAEISRGLSHVLVLRLDITRMTGKESVELL